MLSKKEIMEIIESSNNSPETAYIKSIKKEDEITTEIIDLGNGSRRYFVRSGNVSISKSTNLNYTHAVIGIDPRDGKYRGYGFHSKLSLAENKKKKIEKEVDGVKIVELINE